MASATPRSENQLYRNWVTAALALSHTRNGLVSHVEHIAKTIHERSVSSLANYPLNSQCEHLTQIRKYKNSSPTCFCIAFYRLIQREHVHGKPNLKDTDPSLLRNDYLEYLKCFGPRRFYRNVNSLENADLSFLTCVCLNNRGFHPYINCQLLEQLKLRQYSVSEEKQLREIQLREITESTKRTKDHVQQRALELLKRNIQGERYLDEMSTDSSESKTTATLTDDICQTVIAKAKLITGQQADPSVLRSNVRMLLDKMDDTESNSGSSGEYANNKYDAITDKLFRELLVKPRCQDDIDEAKLIYSEYSYGTTYLETAVNMAYTSSTCSPDVAKQGDKNKRFKSVDYVLKQLKACFESTIKELPDDFNAPAAVADIRTTLRDKHHVVVTGSYNSPYFETALAAVTGMDYNYKRCVEMQNSSDWRLIDPDDVDFVLCKDPFGSIWYDENKASRMDNIFKSMIHATQGDNGGRIDIMLVTDFTILTECKQLHDHEILGQVVKVFDATTTEQSADQKILNEVIKQHEHDMLSPASAVYIDSTADTESGNHTQRKAIKIEQNDYETDAEYITTKFEYETTTYCQKQEVNATTEIGDINSSWENVHSVYYARKLMQTGPLPDQQTLQEMILRLGRKSELIRLVCASVCHKIAEESQHIDHVFAAYNRENEKDLHFVVLSKNAISSELQLGYKCYFRSCCKVVQTEETYPSAEYIGVLSSAEAVPFRKIINENTSYYMTKYKYLSAISARKVVSENRQDFFIVMYVHPCTDKYTSIPLEEDPIVDRIGDLNVIVRNGIFKACVGGADERQDNIAMGCKITSSSSEGFGTLGGFVDHPVYGLCGLTCAHVVFSAAGISDLKMHRRKKYPVKDPCFIYQPDKSISPEPIGRVVEATYTETASKSCQIGVDLALVQIEKRHPVSGSFPRCRSNETLNYKTGKIWGRTRITESSCNVQKFGVSTGYTHGKIVFDGMAVRNVHFVSKELVTVDAILFNQFEIVNENEDVCKPGDSGGLVFMKDHENELVCVGMVTGVLGKKNECPKEGKKCHEEGHKCHAEEEKYHGVATPVEALLYELNLSNLKPFTNEMADLEERINKLSSETASSIESLKQIISSNASETASSIESLKQMISSNTSKAPVKANGNHDN